MYKISKCWAWIPVYNYEKEYSKLFENSSGILNNMGQFFFENPVDALKIHFPEVFHINSFAFSIKWTKWRQYKLIDVDCDFLINFYVVFHKTQKDQYKKIEYKVQQSSVFKVLG